MTQSIRTISLTKKFGKLTAVNNLNLRVGSGEIYGLLGPNGAGKTTVIKMLCGLLSPTSGEAYVLGERVPNKNILPLIGYMPQEIALYSGLTVHQNMAFFGGIYGVKKDRLKERKRALLKFINLEKFADELVVNLSGGMQQRVSLACTLLNGPKLLFLDEPTVGVDPKLRASFWDYFFRLKESGVSIVITTHYMDEARRCDRIGFMREGILIAEGPPQELLHVTTTDSLEDAFLEFTKLEERLEAR
jgi:ABC-2 type transport system ATP-binding protein